MKMHTIHIKDKETIKKLKRLQLDIDISSLEGMIIYLVDEYYKSVTPKAL